MKVILQDVWHWDGHYVHEDPKTNNETGKDLTAEVPLERRALQPERSQNTL